jgi:hypothetical protein
MYHTCDYLRSISFIRGITTNHSIIYKEELNYLQFTEPKYGSRKPPKLFFLNMF